VKEWFIFFPELILPTYRFILTALVGCSENPPPKGHIGKQLNCTRGKQKRGKVGRGKRVGFSSGSLVAAVA